MAKSGYNRKNKSSFSKKLEKNHLKSRSKRASRSDRKTANSRARGLYSPMASSRSHFHSAKRFGSLASLSASTPSSDMSRKSDKLAKTAIKPFFNGDPMLGIKKKVKTLKMLKNPGKNPVDSTVLKSPQALNQSNIENKNEFGIEIANENAVQPEASKPLRIIPLGGLREIGKNMNVIEYGDEMIIIDIGLGFPDDDMPGIDLIIPDFDYIKKNSHKLVGAFFTHGHEDHIGASAWFLSMFDCPVYGLPLTVKLIERKLSDRGKGGMGKSASKNVSLNTVKIGEKIKAGSFEVEFIHVNHSIADSSAIYVKCPGGSVFHTGDFKIDYTPYHGTPIDLQRIAEIGREGVSLLMSESTNAEIRGNSPTESVLSQSFEDIFDRSDGRIFVATFSSNIFRLMQIISAAEKHGRKVALVGRSMLGVFEAADALGYMKISPNTLLDLRSALKVKKSEICFITTGTQGEPMSALNRIAFGNHDLLNIEAGDTVIMSSSRIPGNEKSIFRMIDNLFKRGAEVIYSGLEAVHVTGHAYSEELKLIINLIKPKFFMPVHGEYRHMFIHKQHAMSQGIPGENIFLLKNGLVLEIEGDKASINDKEYIPAEGILVEDGTLGGIDKHALSDRKLLADDGLIVIAVAVDPLSNSMIAPPEISTLGLIYDSQVNDISDICHNRIVTFIEKHRNEDIISLLKGDRFRDSIGKIVYNHTHKHPVILTQVIELEN